MSVRNYLGIGVLLAAASAAHADSAPGLGDSLAKYSDPTSVVAAVKTEFSAKPGQPVRISVYDSEDKFLEMPRLKHQGALDEEGVAVVHILGLEPGEYSFAAYLDENGDGILNRGKVLGRPKEPVAFSNGVTPKLRKPRFDETKVAVGPGSVVVITLED